MNISRFEQRVLHVLAKGGVIVHDRGAGAKVVGVTCYTREGHVLSDCTLATFRRLRRRKLIVSHGGAPYRISRLGRVSVRGQIDNQ
ncbi:MAG: YjhX family toxin [Shimia sp.]